MTKLDRYWKNCLRMYKWVAEQYDGTISITMLKHEWLRAHRFKKRVLAYCFFCQWAGEHGQRDFDAKKGCPECPGALVDARFKCGNVRYDYSRKPKAFYAKILRLDAIRRQEQP